MPVRFAIRAGRSLSILNLPVHAGDAALLNGFSDFSPLFSLCLGSFDWVVEINDARAVHLRVLRVPLYTKATQIVVLVCAIVVVRVGAGPPVRRENI